MDDGYSSKKGSGFTIVYPFFLLFLESLGMCLVPLSLQHCMVSVTSYLRHVK